MFYYDLGSPASYLVAERIMSALPIVPEWEPVLGTRIAPAGPAPDRALIERLASDAGLQALRWPPNWPPDTELAMLAATYAKRVGRAVVFSLASFRQAFAGGRDLGDPDTVLIAGAACEMHPTALLKGIELRSVAEALEQAVQRALAVGVRSLPAIETGGDLLQGDQALRRAGLTIGAGG